jgi:cytoskeleton-associated protein 5
MFTAALSRGLADVQNWKARLSAYNDVIAKSAKTASDTDPFFRPFVSDGALL